ncbi:hypothetical protein NCC49_006599 [Naganishia albida]|nr:hypothetical protein NCC49_006599 [Naganishia albida]
MSALSAVSMSSTKDQAVISEHLQENLNEIWAVVDKVGELDIADLQGKCASVLESISPGFARLRERLEQWNKISVPKRFDDTHMEDIMKMNDHEHAFDHDFRGNQKAYPGVQTERHGDGSTGDGAIGQAESHPRIEERGVPVRRDPD